LSHSVLGINKCPTGSQCDTFQNKFGDAKNFCEKIWDQGFKVVPDTDDCFRLWFSVDEGNPNEAVARRAAARLLGVSDSAVTFSASFLFSLAAFLLIVVVL
jgi:hypothetical protein